MIKVEKLNPFGRMCVSLGMLPSSYKESLTYEEQLLWFCNYLTETVIPTVNNNAEAVEELQALYTEIKTYVDQYFDNLDVQSEINNKLDEMAQSGKLTEIITAYLNIKAQLCYNTVQEMKEATNLTNGSFAKTYGYYNYNDGGGSLYKIRTVTNEDTVDNMFLIALQDSSLVAEYIYINNEVNIVQMGAIGNGETDNSNIIQAIIDKIPENYSIFIPKGTFYCSTQLTPKNRISFRGQEIEKYGDIPTSCLKFASNGFVGRTSYYLRELSIVGTSKQGNGIANSQATIQKCNISEFSHGIDTGYTIVVDSCHIFKNAQAIHGIVDSRIINNFIYDNTHHGIELYQGSNDNIITNNKIEWNGNNGINIYNAHDNVISNNIIDRSTTSAIDMRNSTRNVITGNMVRRNYVSEGTEVFKAHFHIESCQNCIISNNITRSGNSNDDGTGINIPAHSIYIISSKDLTILGNDLSGCTTDTPYNTYNLTEDILRCDINYNFNDIYNNLSKKYISNIDLSSNGGTGNFTTEMIPTGLYGQPVYKEAIINFRRGDQGALGTIRIMISLYRDYSASDAVVKVTNEFDGTTNLLTGVAMSGSFNNDTNTVTITFTNTNTQNFVLNGNILS